MSFHEAESIEVEGGRVWLPDGVEESHVVVKAGGAVWLWDWVSGTYIKISVKDGVPVTEGRVKSPQPDPESVSKSWDFGFKK